MKVTVYAQLHRSVASPTGVGQHILHMVQGLRRAEGVDVNILAPRNQLDRAGCVPVANSLSGIPARALPLDRRWLERMWERLNAPKADRWCPDADWVYTPTEAYIAVQRPRLAVTVHDLHAFEPDLPWSGTPEHQTFRRRWTKMFAPIIKHADCVLAVSEFTRRRLIELLAVDPDRIAVVGNGVEEAYFDRSNSEKADELGVDPYVMIVGGLTRKKGGDLVLRVAEVLAREMPRMRILVAGKGEEAFTDPASRLVNVRLLQYVETPRMVDLLCGATALMVLSRYEGFGIPAAEAMAAGTPVISSRCGALPEVVGEAGILVDAENVGEIVAAIKLLSTDRRAREELCARGRKQAEEYRWNRCVERLVRALRER
jgi:glycosyltransferase involved in cell wall biosynthesis